MCSIDRAYIFVCICVYGDAQAEYSGGRIAPQVVRVIYSIYTFTCSIYTRICGAMCPFKYSHFILH